MSEKPKVSIRLDLYGQLAQKFISIKENRGIKAHSELVRLLISEEYIRRYGSS